MSSMSGSSGTPELTSHGGQIRAVITTGACSSPAIRSGKRRMRAAHSAKQLPEPAKIGMSGTMGSKFRCLAPQIFVLQDHKRLPARFFARISGALTSHSV